MSFDCFLFGKERSGDSLNVFQQEQYEILLFYVAFLISSILTILYCLLFWNSFQHAKTSSLSGPVLFSPA